ncbi:WUSCHEL-related homeobox 5-like [Prosopis cineraria]|uniref:WUSCHEL-related homeobox 5-like n=1 Tax=Prosopis cineraria TaxID=364024 RepID=UPI00240FC559|nr:WUSCHEL-related homeobox 5-like [Prosopis cineraria]
MYSLTVDSPLRLRSHNADQIQNISSLLSFYGHTKSKNVFYWFKNHNAGEHLKRHKLTPPSLPCKSSVQRVVGVEWRQSRREWWRLETLQLFRLDSSGEAEAGSC